MTIAAISPIPAATPVARTAQQAELLEAARRTRRSATAFAAIVARFGREMPQRLEGFHEIMRDVRVTASRLEQGLTPARPQASAAAPVLMAAE
ncbi:hypothetical protein [Caenispirillum bisanense]|uniref:hypothetical protein n=1 Tax=Caenispirillum bisanense TaxID=414052 RepID=UPI0031DF51FC